MQEIVPKKQLTVDEQWAEFNAEAERYQKKIMAQRLSNHGLRTLGTVESRTVEYLTAPYLPRGMITILAGAAGQGKTYLSLWLAALVSNGELMPDRRPGIVYYFTEENDPAVVLRPRLEKMNANLNNIVIEQEDHSPLTMNDPRLFEAARTEGCRPDLVVFDPIQSYLGRKTDMHRANEVRPIMDTLSRFARECNAAVLLVSHLSKPSAGAPAGDPLDRILGSGDFRNAARSICFLGQDPENPGFIAVAQAKNSLGPDGPSQQFLIDDDGLHWQSECSLTAAQLIQYNATAAAAAKPSTSVEKAIRLLREMLEEKGTVRSCDAITACGQQGLSQTTIYRAKRSLGIVETQQGSHHTRDSLWTLPQEYAPKG